MGLEVESQQATLGAFHTWPHHLRRIQNGFPTQNINSYTASTASSGPLITPPIDRRDLGEHLAGPAAAEVQAALPLLSDTYPGSAAVYVEPISPSTSVSEGDSYITDATLNDTEGASRESPEADLAPGYCVPSITAITSLKRQRPLHDVDGPGTSHLSCKKRRLRLQLITSRLSQPFSLPATHILNRESDEGTPVLSRFVKYAAIRAKKAGHQTALVRKAAILNRVRLTVRQVAISRGNERMWRMSGMDVLGHGYQLVTDSTGAMFPGRSGEQVPGPIVPRAWRPHTTAANANTITGPPHNDRYVAVETVPEVRGRVPAGQPCLPSNSAPPQDTIPPPAFIMNPMEGDDCDGDGEAFPAHNMEYGDDEMDEVYADFGVLFGGAGSPERPEDDGHFYEEYLDEVDGITWAS
ncbi:hypothetical protein BX600DRAFT_440779 [Xylariales sp. PMI_506]|nr:hypothetical protein BX600DRAFT_440779 [Xylariales sp. PMI_506]